MYIAKPDREIGNRSIGGDVEADDRRPESLDRLIEDCRLENQRLRVVFALIACLIVSTTERTPFTRVFADRLRRAQFTWCNTGALCADPVIGQEQAMGRYP